MRVAFVGKGGAGKSVIAGTFARVLARRGAAVLAVDSDPMPGLAFSIGLAASDAGIPDEAVVENTDGDGPRFRLRPGLTASEAVRRYAADGPDGVRLLQFGKLRGPVGPLVRSQFAFRQILEQLPQDDWSVVGDLPGGTRQAFFGWASYAHSLLVVVEPTAKALLSARRLVRLGAAEQAPAILVVANKVRRPDDTRLVREGTGLPVAAAIPYDEAVVDADRAGRALIDAVPGAAAVEAVTALVERLAAVGQGSSRGA